LTPGIGIQPDKVLPPIRIDLYDKTMAWLGPIGEPLSVTATPRRNAVSDCAFTVDAAHPRIADLMTTGTRAVVTYQPAGIEPFRLISGRVTERAGENPSAQATRTFTVRDDWMILQTTPGWPSPDKPIDQQDSILKYTKKGPAETVVLDLLQKMYVGVLGQSLTLPADQGRGGTVSTAFRMDYLYDQLFPAVDNAGIIVGIGQNGDHREVTIREPDTFPFTLTEGSGVVVNGSFDVTDATATRIIVGIAPVDDGSDTQTARIFRQFINNTLEAQIGEPVVMYVDGTDIALNDDVTAEAQSKANDAFKDTAAKVNLDITLIESGAFRFGKTFQVGDIVSVQLNNSPVFTDYVREVGIQWDADNGLVVTPKVGNWDSSADSKLIKEVARMGKALRSLQRR